MKVLFFSNAKIATGTNSLQDTGNWASSLMEAININLKDIEVFYAFHSSGIREIEVSKTALRITVIKIPTKGSKYKLGKFIDRWLVKDIYKYGLKYYLDVVDKIQPDIIQIFGLESPFVRLIGNTRIPLVIHLQGLLPPYLYKFYSRFTTLQLLRSASPKSFIKAQTPLHQKIALKRHIILEKRIYSHCNYFLGRTDWDRLITNLISPAAKYYYCQEILREPFYHYRWEQKNNDIFRIFTTIRGTFYKNADIIFEVVDLLEKYRSDFQFIWNIAGIDESDTIVRLMRRKGFKSKRMRLLGRLGAGDLIKKMLDSDLFVFPSAIENSPNALQEAMIVGMPVIATHAGGVSSLIDHRNTGFLIPEGEPYSLAGAIIELKESKETMVKMGNNARSIALERNSPQKVVNSLFAAYNDILKNIR